MLYDVEQVANKLNISKMTVYNKIKLKEHKDKVIKKSGKTYIDAVSYTHLTLPTTPYV